MSTSVLEPPIAPPSINQKKGVTDPTLYGIFLSIYTDHKDIPKPGLADIFTIFQIDYIKKKPENAMGSRDYIILDSDGSGFKMRKTEEIRREWDKTIKFFEWSYKVITLAGMTGEELLREMK